MAAGFVLLAGAIIAKVASVGWLASIATSPVALPSRLRFLQVNQEGLANLEKLGVGPDAARIAELRADLKLLERNVEKGWTDPDVFAAAMRISAWKFAEHVYGAVTGTWNLASQTAIAAANRASRTLESFFTTTKPNDPA